MRSNEATVQLKAVMRLKKIKMHNLSDILKAAGLPKMTDDYILKKQVCTGKPGRPGSTSFVDGNSRIFSGLEEDVSLSAVKRIDGQLRVDDQNHRGFSIRCKTLASFKN